MARILSAEQLERYHEDGILFPVPALSPAETARFRAAFTTRTGFLHRCNHSSSSCAPRGAESQARLDATATEAPA